MLYEGSSSDGRRAGAIHFYHAGKCYCGRNWLDYPPGIETVLPGDIILKTTSAGIWDYIAGKNQNPAPGTLWCSMTCLKDIFRGYADKSH